MSVEDNIAEGRRLVEALGVSRWMKRALRQWMVPLGAVLRRMSAVDPLDGSWDDVVTCLDAEEMKETQIDELRSAIRLVYRARGMASPADDRRVCGACRATCSCRC